MWDAAEATRQAMREYNYRIDEAILFFMRKNDLSVFDILENGSVHDKKSDTYACYTEYHHAGKKIFTATVKVEGTNLKIDVVPVDGYLL